MSASTADAIFVPVTIVVIFVAIGLGIWGYKRAAKRNKPNPWFDGTLYAFIVMAAGVALMSLRSFLVNLHPDPREIVARHYEAIGGIENVASALPIYCKGVVQDSLGKHMGRFQFWYDNGGRFRKEITIGGRLITLVSDGRSRWHTADTISEPDRTDWPPGFWYPDYIVHDYIRPDTVSSKDGATYLFKSTVRGPMSYLIKFPERKNQATQVASFQGGSYKVESRAWLPYWKDFSVVYNAVYREYRTVDSLVFPFRINISVEPSSSTNLVERRFTLVVLVITPHADIDPTLFARMADTTTESLLQQTLDDTKLESYFHPDRPGRDALCIYGATLTPNVSLEKFGRPVTIVTSPDDCANCIIIDSITVTDTTARIILRYPIEGLHGEFSFTKTDDNWNLTSSHFTEE